MPELSSASHPLLLFWGDIRSHKHVLPADDITAHQERHPGEGRDMNLGVEAEIFVLSDDPELVHRLISDRKNLDKPACTQLLSA